mgnify:CR=1 FL=1
MAHVVVPKNRLNELLEGWMKNYRVVAPHRNGKALVFEEVKKASDVILNDEITYKSPKEYLFPQVEKIMTFGDGVEPESTEVRKTIVLGVKTCDLEALKVMTAVFTKGKYTDTYFEKNLNNTVLIGLGCRAEKPGCFCNARGLNKAHSQACDMFLTDSGDEYMAEILTCKGEELLEGLQLEEAPSPAAIPQDDNQAGVLEIDGEENVIFNKTDWASISEKCLGCGTCTFICPTCHCFEFKDTVLEGVPVRYRCWDSCMYPKFTIHASGHNPRASKKERYRQRIMHKYLYVKQNFGYTACTGCGRCIRSCPAGMNIKSVVTEIMENLKNS